MKFDNGKFVTNAPGDEYIWNGLSPLRILYNLQMCIEIWLYFMCGHAFCWPHHKS